MKLCLGTVQFGMNYGIQENGRPNKEDCFKILDYAFSNGINTFDTAKAYGGSEKILGEYFKNKKRDSFKIATKLETNQNMEKEILESLENLQLDYVDYYLFHDGPMMDGENAVENLYKLKEKGYAKKIGVSVYSPEEALKAVNCSVFDCIQIPYNVIDKRLDKSGFFEKAITSKKTVFTRSIFLQGLLFMDREKAEQRLNGSGKIVELYGKLCEKYNLSRLSFACAYIRQKKGIDYCLFGVDNVKQLQEQIEMQRVKIPRQALIDADNLFSDVEIRILDPRLWNK